MRIIIGITGGSGAIYGVAMLQVLKELGIETHLVVTGMGEYVTAHETGMTLEDLREMASHSYDNKDLSAKISSGSYKTDGMIVVPCSMKTLSSIAHGSSEGLLTRAADVVLKEGRKLVVMPRETPLSVIHLENMLKLAKAGVKIMPLAPGFYHHPEKIEDLIRTMVGRALDQLDIDHHLIRRWGED